MPHTHTVPQPVAEICMRSGHFMHQLKVPKLVLLHSAEATVSGPEEEST